MDETVALWILDYLLQKPIDDKIINRVLSSLPISDNNYTLKKMILLRCIVSETKSNGSVSEELLELLEMIEELDYRNGKKASKLMKKAYCAVAVDCTVRFLEENAEDNSTYFEAVERVWKSRVCKMESLISEDSDRLLVLIESAVSNSSICEWILMRNTRFEALKAVRAYLNEAWEIMGPSFLELVAKKIGKAVEELRCSESAETQGGMKQHVAVKSRRPRGAKIVDADDEDIEQPNMATDISSNLDNMQEALQSNSMQMHDTVADPCPDAARAAYTLSFTTKVAHNTNSAKIKVNQTYPEINAPLEVNRVQEAHKSSSSKLHASVTDPLPEALQTAQTAGETKTVQEIHAISEVDTVQQGLESSSMKEHAAVRSPRPDASQTVKTWLSAMETHQASPEEQPRCKQSHICEFSDSIDNTCRDSPLEPRVLANPNKRNAATLEKHENRKYLRRETKKWTPREVDSLRDGVRRFGEGKWKDIRLLHNDVFKDRTEVDLKDKWRNLKKPRS